MDRRRGDAEVALHVGFGRRPAVQARIGVDEGQVLALLVGEAVLPRRLTPAIRFSLFVRASNGGTG